MNRVLRVSIILAMLALPSVSMAQEDAPTAEDIKAAAEEFDLGRRAFKVKDFVEAGEHFESADQSAPSAAALELAIRSRDRAGQLERAATLAALAQRRHPNEAALSELAEGILKRARAELHEARIVCSTPCDVIVDNKIIHGRPTTEWTVFLAAGAHQVRAGWSAGRTLNEEIAASRGGSSETEFEEPPHEAAPEPASPAGGTAVQSVSGAAAPAAQDQGVTASTRKWSPVIFFTGVGLTAALGGVTLWSGLDTVNNPGTDRVREECQGQGTGCALYQDGLDKQRRTNILAVATGVVGLATVAVGVFATDWSGGQKRAASLPKHRQASSKLPHVEPWIGVNSGATIGATGRF